ncbi:peptide ABC transporter substrate-binding protein [Paenibacillus sp. GCM10027628]|uniref:peptide ABC transporter substrate-binding protein n=1 Tax=Paenibacillus sp. GCM10027628 TaxID=3273413 RepID=UPI0036403254
MKRKWVPIALAASLVAVTTAGCSTTDKPSPTTSASSTTAPNASTSTPSSTKAKELNVNFRSEPPVLDSSKSTAAASFTIISALNEGLYRIDKDGKPQPALAKELPKISADGKTYTVTLRNGLTWADGSPLTTKDFDYAFKRVLDPATAAQYSFMLSYIKGANEMLASKSADELKEKEKGLGVKLIDDKTIEFTLDQPVPFFTDLLAFQTYYPLKKDFVEQQKDKFGAEANTIIGAGPFKLADWQHDQSLTLVKNDKYWDKDNVKLDKITLNIVKDVNTGLNLFENNASDVADISRDHVQLWKGKPEYTTKKELTTSYIMFGEKNVPAFKNKKIRLALTMGIDNQGYVDTVLGNGSVAAQGLIPTGMQDGNGNEFRKTAGDVQPKFDVAKAKSLLQEGLQELGLKELPPVHLISDDTEAGKKSTEFILGQWQQNLGYKAIAEPVPHKLRIEKQSKHDFEAVVSLWNGDYNDPMTFLDMWTTGGEFNEIDWSNADYDKLVNGAKTELDRAKRTKMLVDAEKILMDEMPIGTNYFRSQAFVVKTKVDGLILPPMGGDFEFRWATVK